MVKKHRKKTPFEHDDQVGKSIDEIIDMNIYSNNDNNNSNDDEEIGRPHGTEIIDKHNSLSWTSEDDDERGVRSTANDDKRPTTILYVSDNIEKSGQEDNVEKEADEKVDDNGSTPHFDKEEKISDTVNKKSEADVTNVNEDDNIGESKDVDKSQVDRNDGMVNDDGGENVEKTEGEQPDSPATSLSLAPKISSSHLTLNEGNVNDRSQVGESNLSTDTTLEPSATLSPELLTIPSMNSLGSGKRYLSPRASPLQHFLHGSNTNSQASSPRLLNMPDLSDDEDDNSAHCKKAGAIHVVGMSSIFRENKEEAKDEEDIPEIHACGSSVTEVTSNVDGLLKQTGSSFDDILEPLPLEKAATNDLVCLPYKLDPIESLSRTSTPLSELRGSIPLKNVESYKSTDRSLSSNISYFSYEDVSVASEECEMCAICICPYEEGDIRIFSKRCPRKLSLCDVCLDISFHMTNPFDSSPSSHHNELHILLDVFHKECILEWLVKSHNECPCCRVDMVTKTEITMVSQSLIGTDRLAQAMAAVGSEMQQAPPFRVRGSRMARQMMNRARAQRRRSGEAAESTTSETPMSPNANWLWSARFANEGPPSTPRRSNSVSSSSNNVSSNDDFQQPRTINPSRSSDAIMNPHEIASAPVTPTTANGGGGVSIHNHSTIHTSAGSLFSSNNSMIHDHWQQQSARRRARNQTAPITLSPNRAHSAWSRQRPRALTSPTRRRLRTNSSTEESLPVTVLPLSPPSSSSRLHSNWQNEQN